jgi:hypothetical protein
MSSEGLHVPREKPRGKTLNQHYAITSLIEELEAVDWRRQRADDCDDEEPRKILLHNAREELEHAAMVLEWLRRSDPETNEQLKEHLFTDGSITGREEESKSRSPPLRPSSSGLSRGPLCRPAPRSRMWSCGRPILK